MSRLVVQNIAHKEKHDADVAHSAAIDPARN